MSEGERRGGRGEVPTLHEIILIVDVVMTLLQGDVSLLQVVIELLSLSFLVIEILRGHSGRGRGSHFHHPQDSTGDGVHMAAVTMCNSSDSSIRAIRSSQFAGGVILLFRADSPLSRVLCHGMDH